MSYDPTDYGSEAPPPDDRYTNERPLLGDTDRIKGRVQAPAICLIVIGILNLLGALYLVVNTIILTVMPAEKLQSQQMAIFESMGPAMKAELAKTKPSEMKTQALVIYWPLTVLALIASVLPIAGGARMLALKSYALAMCGAIIAAIPCISFTACCGFGEGIGIWAIVVLLNPDVKSAFH